MAALLLLLSEGSPNVAVRLLVPRLKIFTDTVVTSQYTLVTTRVRLDESSNRSPPVGLARKPPGVGARAMKNVKNVIVERTRRRVSRYTLGIFDFLHTSVHNFYTSHAHVDPRRLHAGARAPTRLLRAVVNTPIRSEPIQNAVLKKRRSPPTRTRPPPLPKFKVVIRGRGSERERTHKS